MTEPMGRVMWISIVHWPNHPYCEAPKHVGLKIPSVWFMVMLLPGENNVLQAMCDVCMEQISQELFRKPAEEGAMEWPPSAD